MKCQIPQISWHNRDPVLSVDFQHCSDGIKRLATAGTDTHVLIWHITIDDSSSISHEFVADLSRHTKAVNVVRFSPNGDILASADDEAAIILWKHQPSFAHDIFNDNENNKENWNVLRVLRGHLNDVCDLSWSADSNSIISGSVDNTAIVWDVNKGRNTGMLAEHKGFVQGVAWDPNGQYLATLCSDRALRIYNTNTNKVVYKVQKAVLNTEPSEVPAKPERIFYDDTLKSFCRRLTFSPDGMLLLVPSGICEESGAQFKNASYVFTRISLNKPVLCLPTGDYFTLATRWCPVLFELRTNDQGLHEENLFNLPYRMVFAVATQNSILLYDTQQSIPIGHISNLHYTRLSDLTWSGDGRILVASSTDGYCSFVIFSKNELGKAYQKENVKPAVTISSEKEITLEKPEENSTAMDWSLVLEPSSVDSQNFKAQAKKITDKDGPVPVVTITDVGETKSDKEPGQDVNVTPDSGKTDQSEQKNIEKRRIQLTTIAPKANNAESNKTDCFVKPDVPQLRPPTSAEKIKKPRRVQLITLTSGKTEPEKK